MGKTLLLNGKALHFKGNTVIKKSNAIEQTSIELFWK
jgi:hypothetical protein